jgi:hypothetical protein
MRSYQEHAEAKRGIGRVRKRGDGERVREEKKTKSEKGRAIER